MISNLQLESYRLQDVVVHFNEDWLEAEVSDDASETYHVEPDFDIYEHPDGERLIVRLAVRCVGEDGETVPRFDEVAIAVWGRFSFSKGVAEEQKASLGQYNTVAMLHGIARGMLLHITGGTVGGPFVLPSLDYKAIVERKIADAEASDSNTGSEQRVPREPEETEDEQV